MQSRNQNIVNVCYSLVLIYIWKTREMKILNISVNSMESDKAEIFLQFDRPPQTQMFFSMFPQRGRTGP